MLALFALAFALLGASAMLEPFHLAADGSLPMVNVPDLDSEAYFSAREQAVTAKFKLQDYGVTVLIAAVLLAAIRSHGLRAPSSRLGFVMIAFLAPTLYCGGVILELYQANFTRLEFPPWADSLGIPLMGVPPIAVVGLVWSFSHLVLLRGAPKRSAVELSLSAVRSSHWWLLTVSILTAIYIAVMAALGEYLYAVPGLVWLYFYAAIAAVRQAR